MADGSGATSVDRPFEVRPPAISLPKGGGAVRGIGEKFGANPVTGTGSMTVPVALSPGRGGPAPGLTLSYDSGAGNGLFGFGWTMSVPEISRRTEPGLPTYRGPAYPDPGADVFVLAGAEDLVPALARTVDGGWDREPAQPRTVGHTAYTVRRYRPRTEGAFTRIEWWTNDADEGDSFWRTISADNVTTWYGRTGESRIADPADGRRVYRWLACESYDALGNVVAYHYKPEDSVGVDPAAAHERNRTSAGRGANRHLKRVLYGNREPYPPVLSETDPWPAPPGPPIPGRPSDWLFDVVLDYGEHDEHAPTPDDPGTWLARSHPFSSYRAGFEVRTYRLCRRVLMFHQFDDEPEIGRDYLVATTAFRYDEDPYPVLRAVTHQRHRRTRAGYRSRSLPPVEFEYSRAVIDDTVREVDPACLPEGVDGTRYQWVDLDGEGLTGILTAQGGAWFYHRNLSGGRLGPARRLAEVPARVGLSGQQLLDLSGGGRLDVAVLDGPAPGFYRRDAERDGWLPMVPFARMPNVAWRDPNLRFVDLTGDGRADVMVTGDEELTWYPSLGEDGFGAANRVRRAADEERGPRLVFADGTHTVYLADLSGDGFTDLVRVGNGTVCYWPNLGYGRFGPRVTMDDAPCFDAPDRFDPARVRFADVDGTGPTDLIYLGADRVDVYLNRAGNRWAAARTLTGFSAVDDLSTVHAVDLLGNGTASLVWSSPAPRDIPRPIRYIDLMGGQKPNLLVRCRNNLGGETEVRYAPSTAFALADRAAGRPWATRLPFPVHVVAQVVTRDLWRGTEFTSSYRYHHGHYDGAEREFRGFGSVEHIDVQRFHAFALANAASPDVTQDTSLYQPPVKTVTWNHTGVFVDRRRILSLLAGEYLRPAPEHAIGEPDLAGQDLTAQEWREALRACRGMTLREEVYELDADAFNERGVEQPVRLCSATEHGCAVRMLQPTAGNAHAVFLATGTESVTYHYELDLRDPLARPDPRIAHTFVLETDPYGRPVHSAEAVYPRRGEHTDAALGPARLAVIREVQREPHLSRTFTRYTDELAAGSDAYRLPVPYEVRGEAVTGVTPGAADGFFTAPELRVLPVDGPGRRTLSHHRTVFLRDDLQGPLPLGEQGSLGLPYESYRLALTADLLTAVLGDRLDAPARGATTARELLDDPASGYLHGAALVTRFSPRVSAGQLAGQYWSRSGVAGYAPDAAAHFYRAERYVDPYGALSTVDYDRYDLFVSHTRDPAGNETSVESFDYRVLGPRAVKDANDNISEAVVDVLGMVAATALRGKGTEGDDLTGLTPELVDLAPGPVAAFCAATVLDTATARTWLGGASARYVYHLGEECDPAGSVTGWAARPPGACAIARERHADPASPLQVSLECSDGSGGVLMRKSQAEAEPGGTALRWIVAGKTVLNNKGKPVKQYEPYFSPDFGVEEVLAAGVTPVMYYDAAGRLIRTELPDGAVTRVKFSPWHMDTYDANDTVADPGNAWYAANSGSADADRQWAAARSAAHAGTPSTSILDSLGRNVVTIDRNRTPVAAGTRDDVLFSVRRLDVDGHALWARDARGNLVTQHVSPPVPADQPADPTAYTACYDLAGNALFAYAMDSGGTWSLADAGGRPMIAWSANQVRDDAGQVTDEDRVVVSEYDALRRPLRTWLIVNGGVATLVELAEYGESLAEAKDRNLRGQLYRQYEPSGRSQVDRIDFAGNHTDLSRRLVRDFTMSIVDWQGDPEPKLETETYLRHTEYDAVGRAVSDYNWHLGVGSQVAVTEPGYNKRGSLTSVSVTLRATRTATGYTPDPAYPARPVIEEIRYDARGQRDLVRRGNGTQTRFLYDPWRFRLTELLTTRSGTGPGVLQHLRFSYDAQGNVLGVRDDAYEPVYFNNQRVEAESRYTYDALYRLVAATGRESDLVTAPPAQYENAPPGAQFPVTAQTLRNYAEEYDYDAVGNLTQVRHAAGPRGSWTRTYQYAPDSNRLARTWLGNDVIGATVYAYDARGNLLNLANVAPERYLRWDHRDLVRALDLQGGGWAYYTYHSNDHRVRQVATLAGRDVRWQRIDLGGYERYRRYSAAGAVVEEIESHHVPGEDGRLLLIDDVLVTNAANLPTGPLFRFQHGNHQGSVVLELDERARVISYEEFHPYGTSAYRAVNGAVEAPPGRYRHTGTRRDEESGLDYRGARYYAPWLGRWLSADPAGTGDGPNRYLYSRGSPVTNTDTNGRATDPPPPPAPFGPSGPYSTLDALSGWTREHLIPGMQQYWVLAQRFGTALVDRVYGRLYSNNNAVLNPNTIARPKTYGPATPGLPQAPTDNQLTGLIRQHARLGWRSNTQTWFLVNMRNIWNAMRAAAITPTAASKQYVRDQATVQMGAFFRMEVLLRQLQAGGSLPKVLTALLRPQQPPPAAPPPPGAANIVTFAAGAAKPPPPPSGVTGQVAPGVTVGGAAASLAAPAPAASAPAAPAAPSPSFGSRVGSFLSSAGGAGVAVGLPMAAGYLASLPFKDEVDKVAAATLVGGAVAVGLEWAGNLGTGTVATAVRAGVQMTAGSVASGASSVAGAASSVATSVAGAWTWASGTFAAGGAAGVGVGAGAVVVAGAVGFGIGYGLNKLFVEKALDNLATSTGAYDWWYQHVLK